MGRRLTHDAMDEFDPLSYLPSFIIRGVNDLPLRFRSHPVK
jgi:hypothetical protein